MINHLMKMHELLKASPEDIQIMQQQMAQAQDKFMSAPRKQTRMGPAATPESEAALENYMQQRQGLRQAGAIPGPGETISVRGPAPVKEQPQAAPAPQAPDIEAIKAKYGVVNGQPTIPVPAENVVAGMEDSNRQGGYEQKNNMRKDVAQQPNKAMPHRTEPVSGNPPTEPLTPVPTKRMHEMVQKAKGCMEKLGKQMAEKKASTMGYK